MRLDWAVFLAFFGVLGWWALRDDRRRQRERDQLQAWGRWLQGVDG